LPALQLRAAEGVLADEPTTAARLLATARMRELPPGLQAKAERIAARLGGDAVSMASTSTAPPPTVAPTAAR
jgi:hypothetical protein